MENGSSNSNWQSVGNSVSGWVNSLGQTIGSILGGVGAYQAAQNSNQPVQQQCPAGYAMNQQGQCVPIGNVSQNDSGMDATTIVMIVVVVAVVAVLGYFALRTKTQAAS